MNNPPSPPERPSQPGVNHVLDRLGPLQEPITIGEHPVHFGAKPSGTTTVVPVLDPASAGFPVQFGKYTLLRKLAMGGMAELFLALQRSVAGFEKLVVIKRILPAMNQDEAFIGMLLHEARIAATLSHPNIVQTFDVGEVDGTYFITMEHVHGEDLRSIVRQIRRKGGYELRLEHAISIIIGVCAGLAYAHERRDLGNRPLNIVHRDISPQNVVVAFTGDVKVVDFGIAQSEGGFGYETRSGKLKGKVPYMSPEHARGEVLDSRSDIFAVGIMLFELTTGRRLFKGPSEYETMRLICEGEYPRPSSLRATYPPALEAIVLKALARPREDRFQSAREMQAALEQFARDEHLPLSTIALSEFMSSLFEEKLASQEEALRQGKQLADIIAAQMASDGAPESEAPVITGTGLGVLGIQGALSAPRTPSDAPVAVSAMPSVPPGRTPYRALWGWTLGTAAVVAAMVGMAAMRLQRPTPYPASSAATATAFGAIHLETDPPGASIWLNGDLRPEKTPATLSQLPVGTALAIKVTKEGFEQERATLSLTGATPEAIRLALRPETFALTLHVSPEGLHPAVTVDGKPILGDSVDHLLARDSHVVVVSAPGYLEQTVQVSGLGAETKAMDIALQKVPEAKAPPSFRPAPAAGLPAPRGPALNGKLHVSAFGGWCQVSVDGVPKGPTPIAGMELAAGPHRVTCTQEGKVPVTNTVNVVADSTVRFRFDL